MYPQHNNNNKKKVKNKLMHKSNLKKENWELDTSIVTQNCTKITHRFNC
jgi:hypothetical protein